MHPLKTSFRLQALALVMALEALTASEPLCGNVGTTATDGVPH